MFAHMAWGPSPGSDLKRLGQVTGCWVSLISCWLSLSPHLSQVRQGSRGCWGLRYGPQVGSWEGL